MKKYIHYCWFGDKPLPRLAKKCIKSWKKYLPDYEIIEWSEKNTDLNECQFIKDAYKSKKWAFVADYVRTKALKEMGGIYFDTDMEIVKNITPLLENTTFLGVEDSGKIAVGVRYEKNSNAYLPTKLLKYYQSLNGFVPENAYAYSIPKVITEKIDDKSFVLGKSSIQNLKHGITIYPREYFYPLSYDRQNNIFTDNTCMIHYYDASWVPKHEQRENRIFRIFGQERGRKIIDLLRFVKRNLRRIIKFVLYPLVILKRKKEINKKLEEVKQELDNSLSTIKKGTVLAIYRNGWLGTSFSTKELFDNCIGIGKLDCEEIIDYYAQKLVNKKLKLIVFSAFDLSWANLIKKIKKLNPNQRIKVLWHGSNAMNMEEYDWNVLRTIIEYCKFGLIDSIGFVKKSMYEFYKTKGINCEFVMNTLSIDKSKYVSSDEETLNKKYTKIGLYASGDRWVKNFYNQLSAASMIKNHLIDCVPMSEKTMDFANLINANIVGEPKPIARDSLLKRMATNDINVYVTFVECAPLLPIESLELGIPCITGNNHHYWEGTELEEYLIVDAADNIIKIKEKIDYALKNKDRIIELYTKWKKEYDKEARKMLNKFIDD